MKAEGGRTQRERRKELQNVEMNKMMWENDFRSPSLRKALQEGDI